MEPAEHLQTSPPNQCNLLFIRFHDDGVKPHACVIPASSAPDGQPRRNPRQVKQQKSRLISAIDEYLLRSGKISLRGKTRRCG
jgi:hypothetical protein